MFLMGWPVFLFLSFCRRRRRRRRRRRDFHPTRRRFRAFLDRIFALLFVKKRKKNKLLRGLSLSAAGVASPGGNGPG